MADKLLQNLADAEASVERIKREIASGPCRQVGHSFKHIGGCNAGCNDWCGCSVPVNECTKCGDSDYGQNDDADRVRSMCATERLDSFSLAEKPAP